MNFVVLPTFLLFLLNTKVSLYCYFQTKKIIHISGKLITLEKNLLQKKLCLQKTSEKKKEKKKERKNNETLVKFRSYIRKL